MSRRYMGMGRSKKARERQQFVHEGNEVFIESREPEKPLHEGEAGFVGGSIDSSREMDSREHASQP